jgi:pyruvate formate lyase activating enzyme
MQDRFAVRLFTAARKMGVHTCLNSNGALHERLSDAELEEIDLVITDIKAWDRERHIQLTGKDNAASLEFLRRLAARKRPLWVRLVVIPGLTDDPKEVENTAKFAASLGNVQRVDVLPFHQMGRYKWKELGLDYKLEETRPPTPELVKRVCDQFAAEGLKVV